jgi:hypothetical protein
MISAKRIHQLDLPPKTSCSPESFFIPFTYFLLDRVTVEFGKSILLPLKNSLFFCLNHAVSRDHDYRNSLPHLPRCIILSGIGPITTSIIAKCSRLSCVWNSASPVKNSTRIHPIENMSQGYDHGNPGLDLALYLYDQVTSLTKNNLRGSVMSSTDNGRVILALIRG